MKNYALKPKIGILVGHFSEICAFQISEKCPTFLQWESSRQLFEKSYLKRSAQISTKVKGLDQAFFPKGLRVSKGQSPWSLSADSEIFSLTAKVIKAIADKLKIPKAACTENSKSSKMKVSFQTNQKLLKCRRLETKSRSVRNDDFGFRRKAQVRTNILFIYMPTLNTNTAATQLKHNISTT